MRRFSETEYFSLKRVLDVAYELAGGVTVFQYVTRVVTSQLSKYASTDTENEKRFIPVDVALDLDRAARKPVVTAKMAELLGYRLEPMEQRIQGDSPLSENDALLIMDEATALWRMARQAFADGRLDALEKQQLRLKLHELIRAAMQIIPKLDGMEERA
ncbi:MAG TPA: hypothetical protein VGC14_02225 [Rhizobium sp.]